MSSTNVHSQNSNKYCASAQIIPTLEKGLEIPPKNAKKGPARDEVKMGIELIEISSVGNYEIKKDGTVIDSNSGQKLGKVSMKQVKDSKDIRDKRVLRQNEGMEH